MSEAAVEYETRGVEMMARLTPHYEEQCALADDPSASALLARVMEELAEAAFCHSAVEGHFGYVSPAADDDPEYESDFDHSDLQVAVRFLRVALAAVNAAARIHPDVARDPIHEAKAYLLEGLDNDASDWIDTCEAWDDLPAAYFISAVTALVKGAAGAACELDGLYPVVSDELELVEVDGDDEEEPDPAVRFGDSLFQAAAMAVAAAQWFEERHVDEW